MMDVHERVLKFLGAGKARISPQAQGRGFLLEQGEGRRMAAPRDVLAALLSQHLVRLRGQWIELREQGTAYVLRNSGADLANQHRYLGSEQIKVDGHPQPILINHNESPLAALARRRNKSGAPFLHTRELSAGERLRADYTRGQIMPRLGANWEAHVSSGRREGGRGILDLTDAALGARQRVEAAIDAVGPELAGVLIDVCCFLKGLETVEMERGWPARSAKIMLKSALSVLSRHYEPERGVVPRMVHWGTSDFRPSITPDH